MEVRVQLAGPLRLTVGGRTADGARLTRQDTLALAYLVLERGRQVAQTELADALWDERLPASWKTALRGTISRLRSVLAGAGLPGPALLTGPGWYELCLPTPPIVDVEEVAAVIAAAGDLLNPSGPIDPDGAAERASAALAVVRQPFLVGMHGAWVEQRQQLLDDVRLRCLEVLATASLHKGAWAAARDHAIAALSLAPLRESLYRMLALAHAGAGDRGEALAQLAACRRMLAEELGAPPSAQTEALSVGLLRDLPVSELLGMKPQGGPGADAGTAVDRLFEAATPLVGRIAENARLRHAWKRAAEGTPEFVIVSGEAGAGKSRLIAELASGVAAQGATVLYGRCDLDHGAGALLEALRGHLPPLAATASDPSAVSEAVRSALCRLGGQAPVLLVLDDLQLLGRHGGAVVRYLLRSPDPLPLLLVGALRTGEPDADRRWAALRATAHGVRAVTCVDLSGLSADETAELVRSLTGTPPSATLTQVVVDATGGNPLFVRELVALWTAQGRLAPAPGVGSSRKTGELTLVDAGSNAVPDGVRATILARCRRLRPATRRVLAVAAVAGREIDLAHLEVVPELSTVDVLAALEEAVDSRLMLERSVGRFAFVHGLVPETLLAELSASRRRRLHADLAEALSAGPATAAPDPARIAYHLLRGGQEVAERAVVAASRAAAQAQHRHSYTEAADFFAAALAVAGTDPVVACRLRLEQAWALWRAGNMTGAQESFRAAAAAARAIGRPDLAGHAIFGAAGHGPSLGRCDADLARELEGALRDLAPADPFEARLLARLGAELAGAPDPTAAARCRRAVALAAEHDDPCTVAYALHCLNWASLGDAGDRGGLERSDQIIATAVRLDDRHMELEGLLWRCTYLLRSGRVAEVPAQAQLLADLATAIRQPFFLRLPPRLRMTLLVWENRLDEAEALAAEIYPAERRAHPRDAEAHALLRAAAIAHTRGVWPELDPRMSEQDGPHWTAIRAVWLAGLGQVAAAADALKPVLADGAAVLRCHALAPFIGALVAKGCADHADLARRVELPAVRAILEPWRGTHAVAGCAVASLGPVDAYLQLLPS